MLTLKLPPTTNAIYRHAGHTVYMTAEAKAWQQEAMWTIKMVQKPLHEPTELVIHYHLKRDRDVDGSHKIIIDTLQKMGWFKNDSVVKKLTLEKFVDKNNPRVEIEW